MSDQITTAMVQGYRANVDFLLQQRGSLLRGAVRQESQNVESDFYDRIGATDAVEDVTRHGDTQYVNTPHDRRRVTLRDFHWADLIDKKDKLRLLMDPQSAYAINAAMALGRKLDDIIIEAAFGTAYTGKTGSTAVAFPAGDVIAVDYHDDGGSGNTGLTIDKLRRARTKLKQAQVMKDEPWYIACAAHQIQNLLTTTQIGSQDFNMVKALVQGEVNTFMGFTFIESERLLTDVSSYRRVIAWTQSGILLAIGDDINTEIDKLPTKKYSVQVFAEVHANATRMEEGKVLEILCDETV